MNRDKVVAELVRLAKELLAQKVNRIAYLKQRNPELLWQMDADKDTNVEHGYKLLERTAFKELHKLKDDGLLDYYDSGVNVSIVSGINGVEGFEASVSLLKFSDGLEKALRRLKFKVK